MNACRLAGCISVAAMILVAPACSGDGAAEGTADAVVGVDSSEAADTVAVDAVAADGASGGDTAGPACAAGAACDDGDPCTLDDTCDAAGVCVGTANPCDDGLSCTADSCERDGSCSHARIAGFCLTTADPPVCVADGDPDPANGCRLCSATGAVPTWTISAEGAPCDDGDACTTDEVCETGQCVPKGTLDCTSDVPCVASSCDSTLGCVTTNTTDACDDGDPCTVGDVCAGGACTAGTDTLACDDDDPCTVDSCVAGAGCDHDPTALCDDGDPCTDDRCLEGGHCQNTAFTGPCEDGDPCTEGEQCDVAGHCQGGAPADCDDGSDCTLDSCHPTLGCLNLFVTGECDDGEACTDHDRCVAGQCFGGKTAACGLCEVTPTELANKIISLKLSSDGDAGSGLDVDGDADTCAPASSCSGGVDNALGVIAPILNPAVSASVARGAVKWIIDLKDLKLDGDPFPLHVYDGDLTDASAGAGCDFQSETCEYDIGQLSFDQDCVPYFSFDNARVVDGEIVAGGTDSLISMVLPIDGGGLLSLTVAWARVRASYTEVGGKITSMSAVISGAVPKAQLIAAIEGLAAEALPIDKDTAIQLLELVVVNDIDLDGDGVNESASLGMRINTIEAIISE